MVVKISRPDTEDTVCIVILMKIIQKSQFSKSLRGIFSKRKQGSSKLSFVIQSFRNHMFQISQWFFKSFINVVILKLLASYMAIW